MMYYPMNKDDLSKNKDYAVLLANRSAALENMNCYEAVIQDVDLAFKYGYPKELFFKVVLLKKFIKKIREITCHEQISLFNNASNYPVVGCVIQKRISLILLWYFQVYNRKGNAQFKRKQYLDAKNSFDQCKDYIGKSDMKQNERDRWRIKMAKQASVFNSAKKGRYNNFKSFTNQKFWNIFSKILGYTNEKFPERPWTQQLEKDSVVEIKENNLKTTKEINVEEILHSETPFAAVLMDGKKNTIVFYVKLK